MDQGTVAWVRHSFKSAADLLSSSRIRTCCAIRPSGNTALRWFAGNLSKRKLIDSTYTSFACEGLWRLGTTADMAVEPARDARGPVGRCDFGFQSRQNSGHRWRRLYRQPRGQTAARRRSRCRGLRRSFHRPRVGGTGRRIATRPSVFHFFRFESVPRGTAVHQSKFYKVAGSFIATTKG